MASLLSILACLLLPLVRPADAQSVVPHPRLLFTSAQIPGILARANTAGTPMATAYGQMVTSVGMSIPSNQMTWSFLRNLRRMQEVALRYRLTGNTVYASNARAALLTVCNGLTPTGTNAFQTGSYPCAVAVTFDLIHDYLSPSDRATVVGHLEAWVNAIRAGANSVSSYNGYQTANDNHSFAWSSGIVMALLAIEGESNYPNLQTVLQDNLTRLNEGWRDAVSPDGSYDESYGYVNYGVLYSTWAGIAARNCGHGDWIQGTALTKIGAWVARSFVANSFPWVGDCSPSHKGLRVDPLMWYGVDRERDATAYWGLNRLFAAEPVQDGTVSMAFSPYINVLLSHPAGASVLEAGNPPLTPAQPDLWSAFYRDNENESTPSGNKTRNYFGIGLGGHALLHNTTSSSETALSALYMIRDEWMNHMHEDDGHFMVALGNAWQVVDQGYGGFGAAQHEDHNIVLAAGGAPFQASNYYTPPTPNGRFLGEKKGLLLSLGADYVRGDHKNMWMMDQADRTVLMIKDPVAPYIILIDEVAAGGVSTFDALFHGSGPAYGTGTQADPMRISGGSHVLRTVFLGPSPALVIPGSAAFAAGMTHYRNRVRFTGPQFASASVWAANAPDTLDVLPAPAAGTEGRVLTYAGKEDTLAWSPTGVEFQGVRSDARLVWLRHESRALREWVIAEASELTVDGVRYLSASEPVVASARAGGLDVHRVAPGGGPFNLVARVPFAVSRATLDGAAVPFTQVGGTVVLGEQVTMLGGGTNDDRVYTFTDGSAWDAELSASCSITPDGQLATAGGFGGLAARGGDHYALRPLSASCTLRFPAGTGGNICTWKLEASPSAGDVLTLKVGFSGAPAGMANVGVYTDANASAPVATIPVPIGPTGDELRLYFELDPRNGAFEAYDAAGILQGSATVLPATAPFRVRCLFRPDTLLDDVAVFDSAEDGNTPQGVVMWCHPSGRAGFAAHAPGLIGFGDLDLYANGSVVDKVLALTWLSLGVFDENSTVPFLTSPNATQVRELVHESLFPALIPGGLPVVGMFLQDPATGRVLSTPAAIPTR